MTLGNLDMSTCSQEGRPLPHTHLKLCHHPVFPHTPHPLLAAPLPCFIFHTKGRCYWSTIGAQLEHRGSNDPSFMEY